MKFVAAIALAFFCSLASYGSAKLSENDQKSKEEDWCAEVEDYFVTHCPIEAGNYNGCCLCTQTYFYGCECCREVVDAIGVGGDCTKWGQPTGNDEFCTFYLDFVRK